MEINKIYNMDCLDGMKLIHDESVDLIVTDPPYLMNYKTNRRKEKKHKFCNEIMNDGNEELIKKYIEQCFRIMKKDTAIYIFCNSNKVDFFKKEIEKKFKIKNIIIWVKNNHTAGDLKHQFSKKYEMLIMANKGNKKIIGKRITDVWEFDKVVGNKQKHQNQKPLELIEQCILKHSSENELIFDGFIGSGTTAIACINTNRNYIGFELDKEYFDIANKRIEEFLIKVGEK